MIDWWFFISFNILVLTLGFHTYLAYVVSNAKNQPLFEHKIIKVQPTNENLKKEDTKFMENKLMKHASKMNAIGKVVFIVIMIIFNIIFWIVAFVEQLRPAEDYIISG